MAMSVVYVASYYKQGEDMTVKDLIDTLSKFDRKKEIVFYNLNNNDLESRELETIIDVDGRIEITVEELEEIG